jgi:hypothetical protein
VPFIPILYTDGYFYAHIDGYFYAHIDGYFYAHTDGYFYAHTTANHSSTTTAATNDCCASCYTCDDEYAHICNSDHHCGGDGYLNFGNPQ